MTDGGYGQPPQGGYPPEPPPPPPPQWVPPQGQPPQPPGQAPAYGQQPYPPAQGAPAPKKGKAGRIIALVAVILVVCGLFTCAALLIGSGVFDNKTKKAVALAETHYAGAMAAVETATVTLKDAPSDEAKAAAALKTADSSLRSGRDEIAAAKAAIEPLSTSEGKTQYIASLAAATDALDALQDMLAYLNKANGMLGKVRGAGDVSSKANRELNDAISAGNRGDYKAMKAKATAASADYAKAMLLFREAHALDPSAGLDKAAAYAAKRKEQSEVVRRMADSGTAERVSAYNKDIDRMQQLGAQAEKIGDPAIVSDPQWEEKRLSGLEQRINDSAEKADQLHAVALKALGVTD